MKATLAVGVLVLAVVVAMCSGRGRGEPDRPPFVGCQTSRECGKGFCCRIGMDRYSSPRCVPLRDRGQECRPGGEPVSTTLYYPGGVSVDVEDVHLIHCPCQEGLRCQAAPAPGAPSPVCVDAAPDNGLAEEEVEEDPSRDYY